MAAQTQASERRKESSPANYAFGRVLGEGAFAHCVLAKQRSTKTTVAVKIMLKRHVEREGKVRAVHAEREALARARSDHIVRLIETFQDRDYLFFVLEFCAGGDLRRLLDSNIPSIRGEHGLTKYASSFYAGDVLLGLQFLHSLDIAHRDLKPENVLIDSRGRCKLGDFGAVLDLTSGQRAGSFDGTAEYVSPEVLEGESTTTKCDLWALGCLVFQLSTGRLPFTGATDFLVWEKIVAFADGNRDEVDFTSVSDDVEDLVPTLRESETSVASTKKLVGSASSIRALTDYDWDAALSNERVVAKGILWKRKGLFWRERVFLLTSAPRLVYYDASKKTPERKGVVEWPADAPPKIRRRSPSRFDVCVAGRDYHLAAKGDGDDSADAWITRLSRVFSGDLSPKVGRQGWIYKRGGGGTSAYRRRYAILRGNQLFYYRRPPAQQAVSPQGVVRVLSASVAPDDMPGKAAFTMATDSGRTFYVCVETAEERSAWLAVLPEADPCS